MALVVMDTKEASRESTALAATDSKELLNEKASALGRKPKEDSTRRAYAFDLRDFSAFCVQYGDDSLPATAQTVARYIAHLASKPKKPIVPKNSEGPQSVPVTTSVATIARRMVAISQAHKKANMPNPVANPAVREILQRLRREKGSAQVKKTPLTLNRLRTVLEKIEGGSNPSTLKGKRDKALLLLGFSLASRRSEIAALNIEDLRFEDQGLIVNLRRSKTDQTGKGREISVPKVADPELRDEICAVQAVETWIQASGGAASDPLFRTFDGMGRLKAGRISDKVVARLIKSLTGKAGINGDFSGHSLRSGFITEALGTDGVAEHNVQLVSGHKSTESMHGYNRKANIFKNAPLSAIHGAA